MPVDRSFAELNSEPFANLAGAFDGVIQHSFALQLPRAHEFRETSGWLPHRGRQAKSASSFNGRERRYHRRAAERLCQLFEDPTGSFEFKLPAQLADADAGSGSREQSRAAYSWLLREHLARLDPQPLALLQGDPGRRLPDPLHWAEATLDDLSEPQQRRVPLRSWDGFIFAHRTGARWWEAAEQTTVNDLLLEEVGQGQGSEASEVARVLFQLWAHWRSRLFGVSLASRFFNVFLPYAVLRYAELTTPEDTDAVAHGYGGSGAGGSFLLQPFVSLVREPDRSHYRRTFTFTVLLVPVDIGPDGDLSGRSMSLREVEAAVRRAWGLAADRVGANRWKFILDGPLRRYCANVGQDLPDEELSIRQWIEAMIYCTTRMRRDRIRRWWQPHGALDDKELADRVLTSVASSRASGITVIDPQLQPADVRRWHESNPPAQNALLPRALPELVRAVSGRIYLAHTPAYRVDRPFLDKDCYTRVAVPAASSLITTVTAASQRRYEESGLLQSVFSGYMVLGAATAQSLIRSSYHEIEAHSDPKQFSEISKEFTRDFHEIYDLDITWESYKRTYREILKQFEIMNDYEALHRKVEMLFDATVAEFAEWQHTRLWFVTWLLVFVAVVTVVVEVIK